MGYQSLPDTFDSARPVIERQLKETSALVTPLTSSRKRPDPPRSLIAQAGSLEATITWNAPQKSNDVVSWRIYKDHEGNRVDSIPDPTARQYRPKLPANTPTMFYVAAVNAAGRPSIKIPILATANTDQLVVTGTGGATGGSIAGLPSGYGGEPTGGGRGARAYQ